MGMLDMFGRGRHYRFTRNGDKLSLEKHTPCAMTHIRTNITSEPFSNPHIRKILNRIIKVATINNKYQTISLCDPFARQSFTTTLQGAVTNDLNEMMPTNYHLEFKDFAELMYEQEQRFDVVFFDPPYSLRQLKEQYDGIGKDLELWQTHNMWSAGKDMLGKCVKVGGYVVSLGWTTAGFGKKRGFTKKEVHVFEQVAREDRYSLLLTVERKTQTTLDLQFEGIEEE